MFTFTKTKLQFAPTNSIRHTYYFLTSNKFRKVPTLKELDSY